MFCPSWCAFLAATAIACGSAPLPNPVDADGTDSAASDLTAANDAGSAGEDAAVASGPEVLDVVAAGADAKPPDAVQAPKDGASADDVVDASLQDLPTTCPPNNPAEGTLCAVPVGKMCGFHPDCCCYQGKDICVAVEEYWCENGKWIHIANDQCMWAPKSCSLDAWPGDTDAGKVIDTPDTAAEVPDEGPTELDSIYEVAGYGSCPQGAACTDLPASCPKLMICCGAQVYGGCHCVWGKVQCVAYASNLCDTCVSKDVK